MRFGIVILPQERWTDARARWIAAEQLGFDHAWTYDHLSWRSLAGEPWGATVPTLTAAAVVTERITLGTFVASPNFRHPVPFAKEIATLDDVAGGRFILGVGSGGTGFDATVLGQRELSARERYDRFAEFVADLDVLLRFEAPGSAGGISFDGDWYAADGARMVGVPASSPRVPFVVAANGAKALALAARFGQGWVTTGADGATGEQWWESVRMLSVRLDDALEKAPARADSPADAFADTFAHTFDRYLSVDSGGYFALDSVAAFEDMTHRAAELGFTDVIAHWPRESGIYSGSETVLEEVATKLDGWRGL